MKPLLSAVLSVAAFAIWAQSTSVTFQVDMNHYIDQGRFNPYSEFIDLAGSFNDWGNPGTPLVDPEFDGIYTATVALQVGSAIEFKARINGAWNGREEFPGGGPNRSYSVESEGVIYFWYNDEFPDYILQANFIGIPATVEPGENIQFEDRSSGTPVSWNWSFPGGSPSSSTEQHPVITYPNAGFYDVSLTVTDEEGGSETEVRSDYVNVQNKETFWWNDLVFYEIFVRSFRDSDGDGRGDFQGLIERLDYLNDGNPNTTDDLGITGIWLMPVQQSPSYHGYDVTDYREIERDYGSNQDFKDFIDAAHERGIRVIVDYVMNHSSTQHPWFQAAQSGNPNYRDWYRWSTLNPGQSGPWGQQVWHGNPGNYYYGLFWGGMPDLNYETPAVKEEMFDVATFWLEEMNVDGFRLDAVKYIHEDGSVLEDTEATFQFWKDFRTHYKTVKPDAFAVGEAWTTTEKIRPYVNGGGLDYCFEFDLASAILNAVNTGNKSGLESQITQVMGSYPFLQFGTFLTNHDMNRVMDVLNNDENKARVAAQLLLTLPGIPYLYYGEEIGMNGVKPDEDIRTPLQWNSEPHSGFTDGSPWRAVNGDYNHKNIAAQRHVSSSLWTLYNQLIGLRNEHEALRRGNYLSVGTDRAEVFGFLRQTENEDLLILTNLQHETAENVEITVSGLTLSDGEYTLVNLVGGEAFPVSVTDGASQITLASVDSDYSDVYAWVPAGTTLQAQVVFEVDMRDMIQTEQFDPTNETVELVASFNGFGTPSQSMSDTDQDGIYSWHWTDARVGQLVDYRYRINGQSDAREEFAGTSQFRGYTVRSGDQTVRNTYQFELILGLRSDEALDLQVYPIPTDAFLYIQVPSQIKQVSYQIMDMRGRRVKEGDIGSDATIDVRTLPAGPYVFGVKYNGLTERIKFIKM